MTTLAEIRAALERAATVIISTTPALARASQQSPNAESLRLNMSLEQAAKESYHTLRGLLAATDAVLVTPESLARALTRAIVGHPVGKHEGPQQYDSCSGDDCRMPRCYSAAILAALAAEGGTT